jgi:multicomponent Na+:H+ antiporter subunit C
MNAATLFGLCGAALVGFGLFGVITDSQPLRKILAFNVLGSGVFLGSEPLPEGVRRPD